MPDIVLTKKILKDGQLQLDLKAACWEGDGHVAVSDTGALLLSTSISGEANSQALSGFDAEGKNQLRAMLQELAGMLQGDASSPAQKEHGPGNVQTLLAVIQ